MEWTKQKLRFYLGDMRTIVEFKGITGEELDRIFQSEAMWRLKQIEYLVYNPDFSDQEKVEKPFAFLKM